MKKLSLSLVFGLMIVSLNLIGQDNTSNNMPLIGDDAPAFVANTTLGEIKFPGDYFAKWKILFSHPADFTPVCSSEILELSNLQDTFSRINTQILVLSTDGINSHIEWISALEGVEYKKRPKARINFPIIADEHLEISKKYGMIHPKYSNNKDIRGVFIIDPDNKIRAIFFYPVSVGRNFNEIKRTLLALQNNDKNSVLTPANWNPGDDVMLPAPTSISDADKLKRKNDPKLYNYTWFMWFRKMRN